MRYFLSLCLVAVSVEAAVIPNPIPRQAAQIFMSEGLFQGGTVNLTANLEAIRFATHPPKTERWVFDFADPKTAEVGSKAPEFQIRYVKGTSVGAGLENVQIAPAKFIFTFRNIGQNKVETQAVARLLRKSKLVKDVVFYPAIEGGDIAVEFILKQNVLFEAHQPLQKEGRLVLDLRSAAAR